MASPWPAFCLSPRARACVRSLVLQAVGRKPNGKKIAADKACVAVTDRGFILVDIQMRTKLPHIFAIGKNLSGGIDGM